MRLRDPRTQFILALLVLLAALGTVVSLGIKGLTDVDRANRVVFSDHFQHAVAIDQLSLGVARVHIVSLEIAGASTEAFADEARARLDEIEIPAVESALTTIRAQSKGTASEAQITRIDSDWNAFLALTTHGVLAPGAPLEASRSQAAAFTALVQARLNPIITFMNARRPVEYAAAAKAAASAHRVFARSRTWLIVGTIFALLGALAMIRVGWTLKRLLELEGEARDHGESTREYTVALQATESEDEAHELLRRQVERTAPAGSCAVVLARNNSDDRLEPRTVVPDNEVLRDSLRDATPKSCLAIRFARSHVEGLESAPLISCDICGGLPGVSTCEPLLVGGIVTGSVLINHQDDRSHP
jgi:hypothetical protein